MSREMKTITQVLVENERRHGTIAEASEYLEQVVRAVRNTGGKGEVRITLKVEPDKIDELAIAILQDVTFKMPPKKRVKSVVYQNNDGSLTKTDPRQLELLAEQEAERERLHESGVTQIGRGTTA